MDERPRFGRVLPALLLLFPALFVGCASVPSDSVKTLEGCHLRPFGFPINPSAWVSWNGQCAGGFASGQGLLQATTMGGAQLVYDGPMVEATPKGRGPLKLSRRVLMPHIRVSLLTGS